MGYETNRGNTAAKGGAQQTSIYVPITGLFTNKSGNGLSVMVTPSVLENLKQVALGDKIVFFQNEKVEAGKPAAAIKLIKEANLTQDQQG